LQPSDATLLTLFYLKEFSLDEIGYILDEIIYMGDIAYLSMLLVFGGLGLVASHVIGQRKKLQNKPD